jgi:hypothetical protein
MTDASMPLMADSEFEDLPRTVRREKEARAREAREARERRERERHSFANESLGDPPPHLSRSSVAPRIYDDPATSETSQRFDVPFAQLVIFFIKAALAAVPALILLSVVLYFVGKGFGVFFPDLERTKILISFPPG